ncbi:MAG: cell division protein FtsQ [Prevotella sp.]|nr:cell division protein FtsQ [Prevotella sp.]
MYINWKKTAIVALDLVLAAYITLAMTSFNKPDRSGQVCKKVSITVADTDSSGFLSAKEIKSILTSKHLYPDGKSMATADLRKMENALEEHMLVKDAECYMTQDGLVGITVSQKLPMLRVKADNGEDYYIDDEGHIMSNGSYASDLIVATGNISNWYAQNYIQVVARWIADHELWRNQIVQINVLPDKSLEIVPRIGGHIVCLGQLPERSDKVRRERDINQFMDTKLTRLDKFYRYGLNEIGWNKYSYINIEFDNQIICKKGKKGKDDENEENEAENEADKKHAQT